MYGKNKQYWEFTCDWCGATFTAPVTSAGEGHRKVSTQVQCERCGNFLKNE